VAVSVVLPAAKMAHISSVAGSRQGDVQSLLMYRRTKTQILNSGKHHCLTNILADSLTAM